MIIKDKGKPESKSHNPLNPGRRSKTPREEQCKIIAYPDGKGGLKTEPRQPAERRYTKEEQEMFRLMKETLPSSKTQEPGRRYYNSDDPEDASGYMACKQSRCMQNKPKKYHPLHYTEDILDSDDDYDILHYLEHEYY